MNRLFPTVAVFFLALCVVAKEKWETTLISGETVVGRPVSLDNTTLKVDKTEKDAESLRDLELTEVLSIHASWLRSSRIHPFVVKSADGTMLGRRIELKDDKVFLKATGFDKVFPLETVFSIRLKPEDIKAEAMLDSVPESPEVDHFLVSVNDDEFAMITGELIGCTAEVLKVKFKGKEREIKHEKVYAVVRKHAALERAGLYILELRSGSKLYAKELSLSDGTLKLGCATGTYEIPQENIVSIIRSSDRVVYLSDLDPVKVEEEVIMGPELPWRRDRNLLGKPLRFKNSEFSKGISMRARCMLTFQVPEGFNKFVALAGIQPNMTEGNAIFIAKSGENKFQKTLVEKDDPVRVSVQLNGDTLVVGVEPGENFDLGDYAIWGNARLVKE